MHRSLRWLLAAVVACGHAFALAQAPWPAAPIKVVVPTTAGGASDMVMRLIAQKMSESLKTPVVVENKPGAGSVIGSDAVAKAAPDGYTLLLTYTDHVFNPFLREQMPYDTATAFAPIGLIGSVPMLLVVNPQVPARTVPEFLELVRSQPGKLNFASAGSGSSLHLAGELLKSMARLDVMHIPYKGTAPAFVDLMSGEVQFMLPTTASAQAHLASGKIRALAITSAQRSPQLPQLPTLAEAGLPGYEASIWYGLLAPAGTPAAIVARLNAELRKAMDDAAVRAKLFELGFILSNGSAQDFQALITRDLERWGRLIREQKIRL